MPPRLERLQALVRPDGPAPAEEVEPPLSRSARAVQPVVQIIGLHIAVLGVSMLAPFALDLADGHANARGVLVAALLTFVAGLALALLTWQPAGQGLSRPQAFLLTVGVWAILPGFGALPFVFGIPHVSFTDGYFESMSGLTTTGSTVFVGLDFMPRGALLWRAMLQWFGGLGIVIVAIIFLPAMRIGGMQFFHAVSMDVSGETIPQATQIAKDLLYFYLALTFGCVLAFALSGMNAFDAVCHAFATVSTGGFANYDTSFARFGAAAEYSAIVFMALGGMPFVRFIELSRGRPRPLWRDSQIRVYLCIILAASAMIAAVLVLFQGVGLESAVRTSLFHVTSIITTTGFVAEDYGQWQSFAVAVLFIVTMVGACSGSTAGGPKVFRFQVLFSTLLVQMKRIRSPHGVYPLHYQGRPVEQDVIASIMAFFFVYVAALGLGAIILSLMGLDFMTAISAPMAAQGNVGPGFGPIIGPVGNFSPLPDAATWLLSLEMLLGRLEFLSVLVLLTPAFWRR